MFVFSFVFPLSNVLVSSCGILNTERLSATIKGFCKVFFTHVDILLAMVPTNFTEAMVE